MFYMWYEGMHLRYQGTSQHTHKRLGVGQWLQTQTIKTHYNLNGNLQFSQFWYISTMLILVHTDIIRS